MTLAHSSAEGGASIPGEQVAPSVPAPWEPSKCRVPMWMGGCPAGFCDEPAFGHQLPSEILYRERSFGPNNRVPYCFGHCCPGHGGPRENEPRFFTDGNTPQGYQMWCAVNPDFVNLQESPAGFDGNPFRARELLALETLKATTAPEAGAVGTTEGREPKIDTTREGADR